MSGGKEPLSFLNQSQDHLSGKSMNYLLREFGTEDVDALYELTSQPEVYKIFARLVFYKGAVPPIGGQNYLKLGIILKETEEFIGFLNAGINEELNEPNRVIGDAFSKHYRNCGYTTKAVN